MVKSVCEQAGIALFLAPSHNTDYNITYVSVYYYRTNPVAVFNRKHYHYGRYPDSFF